MRAFVQGLESDEPDIRSPRSPRKRRLSDADESARETQRLSRQPDVAEERPDKKRRLEDAMNLIKGREQSIDRGIRVEDQREQSIDRGIPVEDQRQATEQEVKAEVQRLIEALRESGQDIKKWNYLL